MGERYRSIIFIGPPGVGKGTQASAVAALPGFLHIEMGDILRNIDPDSDRGRDIRERMRQGRLIPDETVTEVWRAHLCDLIDREAYRPDRDRLLLDGMPRTVAQARLIDGDIDAECIIHLSCTDEHELEQRIIRRSRQQSRDDDESSQALRRRLDKYEQEAPPMLDHYPRTIRHDIDGLRAPAAVLADIAGVIGRLEQQ